MEGTTPIAKPAGKTKAALLPRLQLHPEERRGIRAFLRTLACTDAWAEHILQMLNQTDRHGRPIIKHKLDRHGFLKGEKKKSAHYSKLIKAVVDAAVYPPTADDQAWSDERVIHTGSQMKPCFCPQCTRTNPDGSKRHVRWPANYIVGGNLSFTCSVNLGARGPAEPPSPDGDQFLSRRVVLRYSEGTYKPVEEILDLPEPLLAEDRRQGKQQGEEFVGIGEAAEQMRVNENAWRSDTIKHLQRFARLSAGELSAPELLLLEDPQIQSVLKSHRWTQVVGHTVARKKERSLTNLGSLVDFLELGHSLAEVPGLTSDQARLIAELVDCYPRESRLRQVSIKWQEVRG